MTSVPMLDLAWQHRQIAEEVERGFHDVMKTTSFIQGPAVGAFEAAFAAYSGVEHVVGVANGTDAIELSLRALGVGRGDEVIIPANTFVATAEAVVRAEASPVFVDCDFDFLIDPAFVAECVTSRTKAVIGVHLYGQTAPIDELRSVVGPDVAVVEDAAQSQGARYKGRPSGSLGDIAGTSFYPGKNLGAYGDAGAVMTSSGSLADAVRALGSHGGLRKYEHLVVGTNSRLDSLQAVVLSAKLTRLEAWNDERRRLAGRYSNLLSDIDGVILPKTVTGNVHVFHQYIVRMAERDRVVGELVAAGIGAGIHYPHPVHLVPAFFDDETPRGSFPVAEETAGQIVSLPIYPGLSDAQQDAVVTALISAR